MVWFGCLFMYGGIRRSNRAVLLGFDALTCKAAERRCCIGENRMPRRHDTTRLDSKQKTVGAPVGEKPAHLGDRRKVVPQILPVTVRGGHVQYGVEHIA